VGQVADDQAGPVAEDAERGGEGAVNAARFEAAFGAGASGAGGQNLPARMGITIVSATAQQVVATMPVAGNTQPYGLLHGGASCVLAETAGSVGSALHAGQDKVTVGIEISASHHRAVSAGTVTAVATLVHGGSTMTTYEIVITDDRGRRVCTARLSCLLRDLVPGLGTRARDAVAPPGPAAPDV
jgi:1,4-dihydroxy-2-naphthoyl-CoA hydrolase